MGRRKKTNTNNLQIAAIFAIFVGSLLVISLLLKLFLLIRQSTFDGVNRFTIAVSNNKDAKTVISASSDTQSLSVLTIKGSIPLSRIGKFLETPIDGKISDSAYVEDLNQKNIEKTLRSMILRYKNLQTNLTIIDLARLWFFSRTLSYSSILTSEISTTSEEEKIDKISYSLFSDPSIVEEKMSIQIINGTNVSGLGNRLARLITNMGGNVVVVSTSDEIIDHSQILYVRKNTYTVERLQKVLGFPTVETKQQGLSDITIKIGTNSLNSLVF